MKKEKNKQIVLLVSAICLIVVGYLNYDYNKDEYIEVAASTNDINLGDVELVNSEAIINKEETLENMETAIVPNDNSDTQKSNSNGEEYFVETRLQRDSMYSEMIETYQKMIDSNEIPVSQKAIAMQEISNITNAKNGTMIAENLIKNKDFEDVVILVNNNVVSVIIKASILNKEQVAKIQNIVSRELNVSIENINISNK